MEKKERVLREMFGNTVQDVLAELRKGAEASIYTKGSRQYSLLVKSTDEEGLDPATWYDVYAAIMDGVLVDKIGTFYIGELYKPVCSKHMEIIRIKYDRDDNIYTGKCTEYAMIELQGQGCRLILSA